MRGLLSTLKPDRVLVHGDTTTTLAASLAAYYQRIPVGHVEAGLRTGNIYAPWPEEVNRRVTDSIADLLFAPTALSAENLRREGAPAAGILVTGNTVIDALFEVVGRLRRETDLARQAAQGLPIPPAAMVSACGGVRILASFWRQALSSQRLPSASSLRLPPRPRNRR